MFKSKFGIKSNLIAELLVITYLFGSVLVNKFFFQINGTGLFPIIIWLIIWGGFVIYTKKHTDLIDESSKSIISKVNAITVQVMLYCIGLITVFFSTPYTQHIIISNINVGIILSTIMFTIAILRLSLFIYFDKRGIYN